MAIYMPKGTSTSSAVIPKLELVGVTLTPKILCDEEVWLFPEDQIHNVHKVIKFGIKGKNNQIINSRGFITINKLCN